MNIFRLVGLLLVNMVNFPEIIFHDSPQMLVTSKFGSFSFHDLLHDACAPYSCVVQTGTYLTLQVKINSRIQLISAASFSSVS